MSCGTRQESVCIQHAKSFITTGCIYNPFSPPLFDLIISGAKAEETAILLPPSRPYIRPLPRQIIHVDKQDRIARPCCAASSSKARSRSPPSLPRDFRSFVRRVILSAAADNVTSSFHATEREATLVGCGWRRFCSHLHKGYIGRERPHLMKTEYFSPGGRTDSYLQHVMLVFPLKRNCQKKV